MLLRDNCLVTFSLEKKNSVEIVCSPCRTYGVFTIDTNNLNNKRWSFSMILWTSKKYTHTYLQNSHYVGNLDINLGAESLAWSPELMWFLLRDRSSRAVIYFRRLVPPWRTCVCVCATCVYRVFEYKYACVCVCHGNVPRLIACRPPCLFCLSH